MWTKRAGSLADMTHLLSVSTLLASETRIVYSAVQSFQSLSPPTLISMDYSSRTANQDGDQTILEEESNSRPKKVIKFKITCTSCIPLTVNYMYTCTYFYLYLTLFRSALYYFYAFISSGFSLPPLVIG